MEPDDFTECPEVNASSVSGENYDSQDVRNISFIQSQSKPVASDFYPLAVIKCQTKIISESATESLSYKSLLSELHAIISNTITNQYIQDHT